MLYKLAKLMLALYLYAAGYAASADEGSIDHPLSVHGAYFAGSSLMWNIRIFPDGFGSAVTMRGMKLVTQTNSGRDEKHINALKQAINAVNFFHLPEIIKPEFREFHAPTAEIVIILGDRQHRVRMVHPERMKDDPNFKKFMTIWELLIDDFMFKPEILRR